MTTYKAASLQIRAKDALTALFAIVMTDKQELREAVMDLARFSLAELMAEIKAWRDDASPEHRQVLNQHGF